MEAPPAEAPAGAPVSADPEPQQQQQQQEPKQETAPAPAPATATTVAADPPEPAGQPEQAAAAAPAAHVEPDGAPVAEAEPEQQQQQQPEAPAAGAVAAPKHEPAPAGDAPAPAAPKAEEGEAGADGGGVSDEVVLERLQLLLAKSDLSTTTEKMLRKQLEAELGAPLGDKKALIRAEVVKYLEAQAPPAAGGGDDGAGEEGEDGGEEEEDGDEEEGNDDEDGASPSTSSRKRSRGSGGGGGNLPQLSEALQAFLGVETMPRPQIVKRIWEYIREHGLQNPNDKREILPDAALGTILTPPVNMFSMNKQLSRHCHSTGGSGGGSSSSAPRERKPAAKKARGGGGGGGGGGGFTAPLPLSDELAAATGKRALSRGALVKWVYAYAETHGLKDASDKRFVLCDDTLRGLTGVGRFQLFGCQKYFGKHLLKRE